MYNDEVKDRYEFRLKVKSYQGVRVEPEYRNRRRPLPDERKKTLIIEFKK